MCPALLMSIALCIDTMGLNLATYHAKRDAGYEEFNPGVFARSGEWSAGVYRNSVGRWSIHVERTWPRVIGPIDVSVGIVTGYPMAPVMPLVFPSMRIENVRVAYLPTFDKSGGALHFATEF